MKRFFLPVLIAALGAAFTPAQTVTVVPAEFGATSAASSFLGPFTTSPRRMMLMYSATELTDHVGRKISGIALRLPPAATAAWPAADTTIADFTVKIGPGVAPSARSLTFASNYTATPTTVRTGPLTFTANIFGSGGNPNGFGPVITFTTPYSYTGGDLIIEFENGGFSGTSRSAEATLATNGPAGLYGVRVSALWAGNLTAVTGTQANFLVNQLTSISSAKLEGTVTLLNSDGDASDETVQVQIVDPGTNTLVASSAAPLNAAGEYSVPITWAAGTYSVYIKGDTFLKKVVTGVVIDASTGGTANATLTNGDVNNDNEIGPADFSDLTVAFGSFLGDPNYSAAADLNDDEEVGPADFAILAGSFGEFGDDF